MLGHRPTQPLLVQLSRRTFGERTPGCAIVIKGALEVATDELSHLETDPDIYVPWKTYFPFKWTGEDVVEVCEKVLNNPELIASSIEATNQACYDWVSGGGFLRKFDEIMARACR